MTFDLWTLGFQAVNVVVLIWLLQRFFWTPVAAMIAVRQASAGALLDGAEAARAQAGAAMDEVQATRDGMAAERDALLAAARKEAEVAHAAIMGAARAEAAALHDTAKAARLRDAAALRETAIADAQGLALTIAGQLLARLDSRATEAAFLGWLVQGVSEMPEAERAALARTGLEVVSVTDPDAAAQARIAAAIDAALGTPADLTFRTDPGLIAGLELHSPHFSLCNSWRADLARIAAALGARQKDLTDAA